jgi:hypothetical protein
MIPNKADKVMCHRAGFAVSCYDGVVKHRCRLWCHVKGTDAEGQTIDTYGCGDELDLKLLHEIAKEVRQSAASMDKVANEVKETRDMASVRDVLLINTLRNGDDERRRQIGWPAEARQPSGGRIAGFADAPRVIGDQRAHTGGRGLSDQGEERDGVSGADGNPEAA